MKLYPDMITEAMVQLMSATKAAIKGRFRILWLDGQGRGAYTAMRFAPGLDVARKRTALDATTLGIAVRQLRAHLSNQLNKGQSAPDVLASALIIPVATETPERRAFLYLDFFADSEVAWIEDDISFLENVAARLAKLYA